VRQLWQKRWHRRQAQEVHILPPRQILQRELPEGPPQAQHKKACKKRAAELEDEELYGRGLERPEGYSCPICTLPIPLRMEEHSVYEICCMKRICKGCQWATGKRGMNDCAFCRTPTAENDDEKLALVRARVEKKDPEAIHFLGSRYVEGKFGLRKGQSNYSQTRQSLARLMRCSA